MARVLALLVKGIGRSTTICMLTIAAFAVIWNVSLFPKRDKQSADGDHVLTKQHGRRRDRAKHDEVHDLHDEKRRDVETDEAIEFNRRMVQRKAVAEQQKAPQSRTGRYAVTGLSDRCPIRTIASPSVSRVVATIRIGTL